jgi:hypothetical protein
MIVKPDGVGLRNETSQTMAQVRRGVAWDVRWKVARAGTRVKTVNVSEPPAMFRRGSRYLRVVLASDRVDRRAQVRYCLRTCRLHVMSDQGLFAVKHSAVALSAKDAKDAERMSHGL